jgi:hypothetical protein
MKGCWTSLRVGLLLTLAACAAGSGSGESSPNDPTPPPAKKPTQSPLKTIAEFCSAQAEAECSDAVVSACGVADKSACEKASTKSCMASVPQGTTYQPGKAEACLAKVTAAYSSAQITAAALASLDPACGPDLFAGPGAARAPCMTDYDCDSAKGLRCVLPNPPTGTNMGQCFVPEVVPPGGACSGQGSVCPTGSYCDPTGLTCVTDAQLNDGCNPPDYPCAPGLTCSGGGPFATCEAAAADGSACEAPTDCASGLCDKATDQAGGTCASSIMLTSLDSMCQDFE